MEPTATTISLQIKEHRPIDVSGRPVLEDAEEEEEVVEEPSTPISKPKAKPTPQREREDEEPSGTGKKKRQTKQLRELSNKLN